MRRSAPAYRAVVPQPNRPATLVAATRPGVGAMLLTGAVPTEQRCVVSGTAKGNVRALRSVGSSLWSAAARRTSTSTRRTRLIAVPCDGAGRQRLPPLGEVPSRGFGGLGAPQADQGDREAQEGRRRHQPGAPYAGQGARNPHPASGRSTSAESSWCSPAQRPPCTDKRRASIAASRRR